MPATPAMPDTSPARQPLSVVGRVFAVVAVVEAFTWAGLLVGMFLKYVTESTEAGVWLFGRLHGAAFVAYVVITLVAAVRLRWGWFRTLVALAAAVPPLTTLLAERWLRRTGHLGTPSTASAPDVEPGVEPDVEPREPTTVS